MEEDNREEMKEEKRKWRSLMRSSKNAFRWSLTDAKQFPTNFEKTGLTRFYSERNFLCFSFHLCVFVRTPPELSLSGAAFAGKVRKSEMIMRAAH